MADFNAGDLELLINDVRKEATAVQKRVMEDEIKALSFRKRLKIALKIVFKK